MREYHVAFAVGSDIGRFIAEMRRPITDGDQIKEIEAGLRRDLGVPNVVVISWQELRPPFWRRLLSGWRIPPPS